MIEQLYDIPADDIRKFHDVDEAMRAIYEIYEESIDNNIRHFKKFIQGKNPKSLPDAFYPYLFVRAEEEVKDFDPRLSYGFVRGKGVFGTTITRPDLFDSYLRDQLNLLLKHNVNEIYVGISDHRIPLHFSFANEVETLDEHIHELTRDRVEEISNYFSVPDLNNLDDSIANGTFRTQPNSPEPLSLFSGERVDISLQRLMHYTGTLPEHFQNFVLFTNYQFYVEEFVKYGLELMQGTSDKAMAKKRSEYDAFVQPGNFVTYNANIHGQTNTEGQPAPRMPQMPAYHLKRNDGSGITLVNIGVGPSNAKTITDHIAVLRPHCWLMLGHCAGLRPSQRLGDYVLAHAYLREDKVLDEDLPTWVTIPALAEIQQALSQAVGAITGVDGFDMKKIMRTGTVATVADRNWELRDFKKSNPENSLNKFSQCRAIAVDMESATLAANGFRFRVPYGTLLCVSDRPVHGELKLPGMANDFYRKSVSQHLDIGIEGIERLRKINVLEIHSRKLRSFKEPAFR